MTTENDSPEVQWSAKLQNDSILQTDSAAFIDLVFSSIY